ncbi:hypothetical protein BX616_007629, partial [Lobosporangium transversale]
PALYNTFAGRPKGPVGSLGALRCTVFKVICIGTLRGADDRQKGRNVKKLGFNEKRTQATTLGTTGSRTPRNNCWSVRRPFLSVELSLTSFIAPAVSTALRRDGYFGVMVMLLLTACHCPHAAAAGPSGLCAQKRQGKETQGKSSKLK